MFVPILLILLSYLFGNAAQSRKDPLCKSTHQNLLITDFLDLKVNSLNGSQGVSPEDHISYSYNNNLGGYANITFKSENWVDRFYSYTRTPGSAEIGLDVSAYDMLLIKLPQRMERITVDLVFSDREDGNCMSTKIIALWFWDFIIEEDYTTSRFLIKNNWRFDNEIGSRNFSQTSYLCSIEILNPIPASLSISSISFLKVNTVCEKGSEQRQGFVWSQGSDLMLGKSPLKFISFSLAKFLTATLLEQEDLIKTIVAVTPKDKIPVAKTSEIVSIPSIRNGQVDGNCQDCLITQNPYVYNEKVFQAIDRAISVASKYGVKLLMPFYGSIGFSEYYLAIISGINDEFKDEKIFDIFERFIATTLNRNNTITGIKYKDDPTVMGWMLVDYLRHNNPRGCAPYAWVKRLSSFVKAIDPFHVFGVGCDAVMNFDSVPQLDVYQDLNIDFHFRHHFESQSNIQPLPMMHLGKIYQKPYIHLETLKRHGDYVTTKSFFSKFKYDAEGLSGVLFNDLYGRSETDGFKSDWSGSLSKSLHYPGIGVNQTKSLTNPLEVEYMKGIMEMISNWSGIKLQARPMPYPPTFLSYGDLHLQSFTWFGVVGSSRYRLTYYLNNNLMAKTMISDTLHEISDLYIDISYYIKENSIRSKCRTKLVFQLEGLDEWGNNPSPPLSIEYIFKANMTCPDPISTASETNLSESNSNIIIITTFVVGSILILSLSILLSWFCFCKRNRKLNLNLNDEKDIKDVKLKGADGKKVEGGDIEMTGHSINYSNTSATTDDIWTFEETKTSSKDNLFSDVKVNGTSPSRSEYIKPKLRLKTPSTRYSKSPVEHSNSSYLKSKSGPTTQNENTTITITTQTDTSEGTTSIQLLDSNSNISIPGYLKLAQSDFTDLVEIGSGGTAKVFLAKIANLNVEIRTGLTHVAIKYVSAEKGQHFRFEVALLGSIPSHANLLKFVGYTTEPNTIISEKMDGSLFDLIKESKIKSIEEKMKACIDIASGMAHLHDFGILHFDLKPDLGFARPINFPVSGGWAPRLAKGLNVPDDLGFTVRYCSLEMLNMVLGKSETPILTKDHLKIDVYAFAIILYELLSGKKAWSGLSKLEIVNMVMDGSRPQVPEEIDDLGILDSSVGDLLFIMRSCWAEKPSERMAFDKILDKLLGEGTR